MEKSLADKEAAQREPQEVATDHALEERLLQMVTNHPEGMKLAEMGAALGVDWRSLIGLAGRVVRENKVEKVNSLYYPAVRGQSGGVRHGRIDRH